MKRLESESEFESLQVEQRRLWAVHKIAHKAALQGRESYENANDDAALKAKGSYATWLAAYNKQLDYQAQH